MTGARGAEFGKVGPIQDNAQLRVGGKDASRRINLGTDPNTLENGTIIQVSPEDAFKPGQQVLFWLTVYNSNLDSGTYVSRVRLKPWWKRMSLEHRGPGDPGNQPQLAAPDPATPANGWVTPDEDQFGSGPIIDANPRSSVHADNNRLVWFPVPKLVDVTQWQSVDPPPAAPARQSDSIFLDDVWTLDLQNPNDAAYADTQGTSQAGFGRSVAFMYVSHGYALGLTHQFSVAGGEGSPALLIDLTWANGTL